MTQQYYPIFLMIVGISRFQSMPIGIGGIHLRTGLWLGNAAPRGPVQYNEGRYQGRFDYQAPAEVRAAALASAEPTQYPIPENRRIQKFKQRYVA